MYVIIIGCGQAGSRLARTMSNSKDNIVVLDHEAKAFDVLGDRFNGRTVLGDPMDTKVLERAGIKSADRVYVLTGNDDLNIVVGQISKKIYDVEKVVVQVNSFYKDYLFSRKGLHIINKSKVLLGELKEV